MNLSSTTHTHTHTLQSTRGELTNRQLPVRRGLERTAGSLKAQLSGANAENLEQQLAEVNQQWQRLEETLDSRETGNYGNQKSLPKYYPSVLSFLLSSLLSSSPVPPLPFSPPPSLSIALSALISDIEGYWSSVAELEAWLRAGEGRMEECGPIGANLPRLVEQSAILEVGTAVDWLPQSHHHTASQLHHHSHSIIPPHHHTITPHPSCYTLYMTVTLFIPLPPDPYPLPRTCLPPPLHCHSLTFDHSHPHSLYMHPSHPHRLLTRMFSAT